MAQTWGERWRMAAEGDLSELQNLRDDVLDCCVRTGVPWDEALAQTEIVARLAAMRGQPCDALALASILLLRAHQFSTLSEIELASACDHLNAGLAESSDAALARGKVLADRSAAYEAEAHRLYPSIANGDDPNAAAMLVSAISLRSDGGDDDALAMLQTLISGMPKEKIGPMRAALKRYEQEISE